MSNGCYWKQRHRLRGRAGREAAGGGIRGVRGLARGGSRQRHQLLFRVRQAAL